MMNKNTHYETIEDLRAALEKAEEKRARLLKDREIAQHKLVIRDKRVTLAYQEIKRFDEDKNRPKDCDDYREQLVKSYQLKTEDSKAAYYKLEEINRELKRVKSQIRQLKVEIKRISREKAQAEKQLEP